MYTIIYYACLHLTQYKDSPYAMYGITVVPMCTLYDTVCNMRYCIILPSMDSLQTTLTPNPQQLFLSLSLSISLSLYIYIYIYLLPCHETATDMYLNVLFKCFQVSLPVFWKSLTPAVGSSSGHLMASFATRLLPFWHATWKSVLPNWSFHVVCFSTSHLPEPSSPNKNL